MIKEPPNAGELVSQAVGVSPYAVTAVVRLNVPLEKALQVPPASVGLARASGRGATIVELGCPDVFGLAGYLASLPRPVEVLSPPELREAILTRARSLLASNSQAGTRSAQPLAERAAEPLQG